MRKLALSITGVFSALFIVACSEQPELSEISRINIHTDEITLSGLSSGAYMATQFHLAHSEIVTGSGLIAGGPYFCSQGNIGTALTNCVANPVPNMELSVFSTEIAKARKEGKLAAVETNKQDRIWLLHGTKDLRIHRDVSDALYLQLQKEFSPELLHYENEQPFAHLFPTLNSGENCEKSVSPFIGDCDYDAAGEILKHLGIATNSRNSQQQDEATQLYSFAQEDYAGEYADTLGEKGFIYVPNSCASGAKCSLHISFHGCNQNAEAVGDSYAKHVGLNEWAENNDLVVMYPQTKKSMIMPLNPQSCWDWWGYTNADYANKKGPQIQAIMSLINNSASIVNDVLPAAQSHK